MKAHEIMTRNVVTVGPATPVQEIAALLAEKRISGVPVVTPDGTVLGILSESDLLRRTELGTERKRKWWLKFFADPDEMAREYAKSHGLKAEDIMSRQLVSVRDDAELSEIADLLEQRKVKRLPVVREGKLVGIITRGDLVRAFSRLSITRKAGTADDTALDRAVLEKMRAQDWLDGTYINATVTDGVVALRGFIGSSDQRRALRVLIEGIDGVRGVDDQLTVGVPAGNVV